MHSTFASTNQPLRHWVFFSIPDKVRCSAWN